MKALSVIWKIPDDRLKGFSDDKTGLIVVRDLCEYLGRKIESYLLLGKESLPAKRLGNIQIVDTKSIEDSHLEKNHLENMVMAFERALIDIEPDIIHIHDCGDFCRACMKICVERGIPYIFTAHAFIGNNQNISDVNERDIIWQKEVFTTSGINVVAVGKGLADKILMEYPNLTKEYLRVIQNGTDIRAQIVNSQMKSKLGFQGRKVLICPGKITKRKNQIQIVRAFQILPKYLRDSIGIIFCGNDRLNGELQQTIKAVRLEESLKYVGVLNSTQMQEYYSISDGMIMASITEGLSIAALETLTYGLPVIMFSDVECAKDLDDEEISSLAKERTDQALANAIRNWEGKNWDRDYILKFASSFSMDRVADEYICCYKDVIKNKRGIDNNV